VRRAHPDFRQELDRLSPDDVVWEPYLLARVQIRATRGLAPLCYESQGLWLTTATLVYDIAIEPHMPDRVMRQFGQRQTYLVARVFDRVSHNNHRYEIIQVRLI
jgi:hypothetical protein